MQKFIYRIKVKSKKITSVLSDNRINHFVFPATQKGEKIYILGKNGLIHYVGITKQSMSSRLRYGVSPNQKGYKGYKWLKENGDHCLIIWIFDKNVKTEAIEAEIVHFFRVRHDQWPKYQMEIHFHPTSRQQRLLAKKVLDKSEKIVRNFI